MTKISCKHIRFLVCFVTLISATLSVNAQDEISFSNEVTFSKTGIMDGMRLVVLMPAPITNEYQEIHLLKANQGNFVNINKANKILFYDGPFTGEFMDMTETFKYKTKKVKIDFNDKSNKNVITGVKPGTYLKSDGKYINISNKVIKQIGDQLWSESNNDIIEYARLCYNYVATHYKYIKGPWRTLAEIIKSGGGECGDFSSIFINLMIYKGIPARHNMGVWKDGGYHVGPDFYHEDYGWIPVDPTLKQLHPDRDYFGAYYGNLIILSQGLTSYSGANFSIYKTPLQSFYYWYWFDNGSGSVKGVHKTQGKPVQNN